ncbi:MAG: hypothetical protein QOG10_3657 [Kribbellaceae bacterium]|jgi:hypothetical protein|nr:hypothetical protein [Kribbellaceae bacterium]
MATVSGDGQEVTIELARWEQLFAGGRRRLVLPVASIVEAERVDRPTKWSATPGLRFGLAVIGVMKVGRWGVGTKTSRFVSVRRSIPAVRFTLDEEGADLIGYDEVLISTRAADRVIASVRASHGAEREPGPAPA